MPKIQINFDTDSKEGKALQALAIALNVSMLISKEEKEKESCPIAPLSIRTAEEIMNFQQHIRCRMNRVESELRSMSQSGFLGTFGDTAVYLKDALANIINANEVFTLLSRRAIAVKNFDGFADEIW